MPPAPRNAPLQPYSPNLPVFSGMKGCQFAVLMYAAPPRITITTTATLTSTIAVLTFADSLLRIRLSPVTPAVIGPPAGLMIALGLHRAGLIGGLGPAAT